MTPAASVSFFRPEFGDFLYAQIGADADEMPLSVLSALSRLDVDPWEEAAEMSELPRDAAAHRLSSLIARLPGGRWAQLDSQAIADRLVELLPACVEVSSSNKTQGLREKTGLVATMLTCAALGVAALLISANREPSSRGGNGDVPAFSAASPPQSR